MSEKRPVSLNLSEQNIAWMDEQCNNRSAYVDELLTRAREGGDELEGIIARYQAEQLRAQKAQLETRLEGVSDQLERVEKKAFQAEEKQQDVLQEARDVIRPDKRNEDNPAVQTWAKKAEMGVSEFLEALNDE